MKIKNQVSLKRLIGKIDNDFNISESDWIPRVAAWTIDALSQIGCLPMEIKRRELPVYNKIAIHPCITDAKSVRVYDKNGCEIENIYNAKACDCSSTDVVGVTVPTAPRESYVQVRNTSSPIGRNYVLDGNNIDLSFNTDKIFVDTYEVATYYDDYFDCEVPYIYDNGLLLEALSWYILYKYLSRGSKHQVYSLTSNNQLLNPFLQWSTLKNKAKTSVFRELMEDTDGWNNFFYNSTFLPRK